MDTKSPVLVIIGTTASGKTALAVELANRFDGEVISADSRQVYRGLDIGTAKVTAEEMQGVPHHLLDVADVSEVYNAADFVRDGQAAIADITTRGKLPIIAGGTFFYVDLLLGSTTMPKVPPNPQLRAELETMSTDELFAELRERDSARAATIDPHNKRRLVRALEIIAALGHVPRIPTDQPYHPLWLGITRSKDELRERFAKRAKSWLHNGFREEVRWLYNQAVSPQQLAEFGFEYSLGHLLQEETITEAEFIEQFTAKNWQYAKKQQTWLKRNENIQWLSPMQLPEAAETLVANWLPG